MMSWVGVAIGGALGALLRTALQSTLNRDIYWGTICANVLGCLVAGLLLPFLAKLPDPWKGMVLGGFLGALTTMSSFAMEVFGHLRGGDWTLALGHWLAGALFCLLACAGGFYLSQRWLA